VSGGSLASAYGMVVVLPELVNRTSSRQVLSTRGQPTGETTKYWGRSFRFHGSNTWSVQVDPGLVGVRSVPSIGRRHVALRPRG
jgi:hypothetical protein